MADEAVRLMPASLRIALQTHRKSLMRGMLTPLTEENAPGHRPPWSEGALDESIRRQVLALAESLQHPTPFAEIAERFGTLAHFVADAGFPPGAGGDDGSGRYAHFESFCESRLERFPLVFYGHADPNLERLDYQAWAMSVMSRARSDDRELARVYAGRDEHPDPPLFDDRSVPFAVGSLAYSRSVTDIVRIWLTAWREADGDVGRTPYREP